MHACMHVRMYECEFGACVYVCMYVCKEMYACMHARTVGRQACMETIHTIADAHVAYIYMAQTSDNNMLLPVIANTCCIFCLRTMCAIPQNTAEHVDNIYVRYSVYLLYR